jgi:predicted metal-dependent peptidase
MTHDYAELNRQLDKVKSKVFQEKNAAFFGPLMCSLEFHWSEEIPTAGTDGVQIIWNPNFFKECCFNTNKTVLRHELDHAARLHAVRRVDRNPEIWNYACDIRINNDLQNEGYSFEGIEDAWILHLLDRNGPMVEEDIYDYLMKKATPIPAGGSFGKGGTGDMLPLPNDKKQQAVNNVVRAVQQAKAANAAGSIPGGIESMLNEFLKPIIPWESALMKFFTDLLQEDYTWRRPNRRYQDVYLPSRFTDDGRLEHLMYFLDVSGSITEKEIVRFNSEVKYIQDTLKPQKLTLVQFDTRIQDVRVFEEGEPFSKIKIVGRGGTSLTCVRDYIEKHKPTAAVIFSDLYCTPMQKLRQEIPIIWVVVNSLAQNPSFGKVIRITA